MGQKEKLVKKLKSRPKDFTFDEAETLLGYFTYVRSTKDTPVAPASCLSVSNTHRFCSTNHTRAKNF